MFRKILASLLTLSVTSTLAQAEPVALVLGFSDYDRSFRDARTAAASARQALRDAGYRVHGGDNLPRNQTLAALEKFEAEATGATRAVIFIAGRYASKGSANWVVMPRTNASTAIGMEQNGISLDAILSTLDGLEGRSAAFLNTVAGRLETRHGLRAGLGRITLDDGDVVVQGTPKALANALEAALKPDVKLVDVDLPRGAQLEGFAAPSLALGGERTSAAFGVNGGDRAAWRVANAADSEAGYAAYLEQFPQGDFANIARSRLEVAAAPKIDPAEAAEQALALNRNQRRDVQRKLTLLGFNTRGVDGIFGRGSRDAITRFQRSAGHEATGFLSTPMLRDLERRASVRQAEIEEEERLAKRAREDADIRFWRQTGSSGRPEDLRAYVKRYPNGLYADEARREMQRLGVASGADEEDWDRAYRLDTIESYQAYLRAQPNGKFRRDADTRIRVLRANAQAQPTKPAADPAAVEKGLKLNQIDRAALELRLGSIGFNPGFPEGKLDKRARGAIAAFQKKQGITATGYFDRPTVERLMKLTRK